MAASKIGKFEIHGVSQKMDLVEYRVHESAGKTFKAEIRFTLTVTDFSVELREFLAKIEYSLCVLTVDSYFSNSANILDTKNMKGYIDEYVQEEFVKNAGSTDTGFVLFKIILRPIVHLLHQKSNKRGFVNMTTKSICEHILSDLYVNFSTATAAPIRYISQATVEYDSSVNDNILFNTEIKFVLQDNETDLDFLYRIFDQAGVYFVVEFYAQKESFKVFDHSAVIAATTPAIITVDASQNTIGDIAATYLYDKNNTVPALIEISAADPNNISTYETKKFIIAGGKEGEAIYINDLNAEYLVAPTPATTTPPPPSFLSTVVSKKATIEKIRHESKAEIKVLDSNQYIVKLYDLLAIAGVKYHVVETVTSGRGEDYAAVNKFFSSEEFSKEVSFSSIYIIKHDKEHMPDAPIYNELHLSSIVGVIHNKKQGHTGTGTGFSTYDEWAAESTPKDNGSYDVLISDVELIWKDSGTIKSFNANTHNFSTNKIFTTDTKICVELRKMVDFSSKDGKYGMDFLNHNGTNVIISFINGDNRQPYISGVTDKPVVNQENADKSSYEELLNHDDEYTLRSRSGNLLKMSNVALDGGLEISSPRFMSDEKTSTFTSKADTSVTYTMSLRRIEYSKYSCGSGLSSVDSYIKSQTGGVFQSISLGGKQENVFAYGFKLNSDDDSHFGFKTSIGAEALMASSAFYRDPKRHSYGYNKLFKRHDNNYLFPNTTKQSNEVSELDGDYLLKRNFGLSYSYRDGTLYSWHNNNNTYYNGTCEHNYYSQSMAGKNAMKTADVLQTAKSNVEASFSKSTSNAHKYYVDRAVRVDGNALRSITGTSSRDIYGSHMIESEGVAYVYSEKITVDCPGVDINAEAVTIKEDSFYLARTDNIQFEYSEFTYGLKMNFQFDDVHHFGFAQQQIDAVGTYINPLGNASQYLVGWDVLFQTTAFEVEAYNAERVLMDFLGLLLGVLGMIIKAIFVAVRISNIIWTQICAIIENHGGPDLRF